MERYKVFFDESRDAFAISKRDGTIVDVNQAWLDVFGYTRDDIVNLNARNCYFHPEDRIKFREEVDRKGSIKDFESEQRRKDGTRITCLLTSTAKEIKVKNAFLGYMGIIRDVTEQKKLERASAQRQKALQAVYQIVTGSWSSLESISQQIADNLRELLQVSYVIIRRLDNHNSTIIGASGGNTSKLVKKIAFDEPPFTLAQTVKGVQQFQGELQYTFPHNPFFSSFKIKSYLGVPVINSVEKTGGMIELLDRQNRTFDDAEIRLVEIFVRYIENEFDRRLMEKQLRDAHRMKIVGQMAAGIAHEVRNPLAALTAVTEALALELKDIRSCAPYIEHITTQIHRLSRLMTGLLDLGKPIESTSLHKESLITICASASELWRKANAKRKGAFIFEHPKDCQEIPVLADSAKLQQVFFNLLNNAAEASDDGSEITMVVAKPEKGQVLVAIVDHGVGILEEHLPLVFEPFFTTKKGGTGLGLSIVKNIVKLHGGRIKLASNRPQPGCTAKITLPLEGRVEF